jgi:hypothetical protein
VPAKRFRPRLPPRRSPAKEESAKLTFAKRSVPLPAASVTLLPLGAENGAGGQVGQWELVCRDGWEWQRAANGLVQARTLTLNDAQATVVREWIEKIRHPGTWWAVSRELNALDSSPEVAAALRAAPWLGKILPVLLEASVDGAPPPP